MEFIKKIINRIINFFKNNNQKLLMPTNEENNFDSDSSKVFEEIVDIKDEVIDDFSQSDIINFEDSDRKKEFFETYQKFKEGKIKVEHLLITDLIDFEIMMQHEEMLLAQKIEFENEKIEKQKIKLLELNNEIVSLNKILNT